LKLLNFSNNKACLGDILNHLSKVDSSFVPNLSSYIDLKLYSKKISENAERVELWRNEVLVDLLAF
jgi:hypothetical protein